MIDWKEGLRNVCANLSLSFLVDSYSRYALRFDLNILLEIRDFFGLRLNRRVLRFHIQLNHLDLHGFHSLVNANQSSGGTVKARRALLKCAALADSV
jgi:hypothetical protein